MNKSEVFNELIQSASATKQRLFLSAVYLFSAKGFANVGIRELCRSVNIMESAFYNHFKSKDALFEEILNRFLELSSKPVFTNEEIEEIIESGDIERFLRKSIEVYRSIASSPLYFTLLQIVLMESYTDSRAWQLVKNSDYYLQLEKLLEQMAADGYIRKVDIRCVVASYYYGIKGIMQEYLLREVWNEDTGVLLEMLENHIDLFVKILKV